MKPKAAETLAFFVWSDGMNFRFKLTAFLALCVASPAHAEKVKVVDVIDGDTFVIEGEWAVVKGSKVLFKIPGTVKVRVLGIDTPEKGSLAKCPAEALHSVKATAFAKSLFAKSSGEADLSAPQHDKYGGRLDAEPTVTMQGVKLDYKAAMIAGGYARAYIGEGPKPNWCEILKGNE